MAGLASPGSPEHMKHDGPENLVSVMIRSTGRPEMLKTLQSVAAQSHPGIEVLIADVQGEGKIQEPAGFPHPVRILSLGHRLTRPAAANALLAAAQGRWGLFLDDDDWLDPSHIERLAVALAAQPDAVLSYAGVSCVEEVSPGVFDEVRLFDEPFNATRLLVENYIPIHASLLNLAKIRGEHGPSFDLALDIYEDWDFWLQCLPLGPFVHVAGATAYYRIHSGAGTGVRFSDEEKAVAALDQLIAKWRLLWTPAQLRDWIGFSRHVVPLQTQVKRLEAEALLQRQQKDEVEHVLALERDSAARERKQAADLLAQEQVNATRMLEQAKADGARAVLDEKLTAARLLEAQKQDYESSRSWRVTRPLRAAMQWAREQGIAGFVRSALRRIFFLLLQVADFLYRWPPLRFLRQRIPYALKRHVRNMLVRGSMQDRPSTSVGAAPAGAAAAPAKVSVVIPVYGHARFIERCIRSALEQTWDPVEVIVIDDASPDPEVSRILDSLAGAKRIKILRNERNMGICHTQNRALAATDGQIIAFLDCDDYLAPDALEKSLQSWRDDTVYLHTGRINVDEDDREINRIHFKDLPREDYFQENLRAMYATHLKMIRRDVFAKVGLFDPRFDSAQDYEMLMRIAFHYPSSSFVHVPDFLYYHRLHRQQTTETQKEKQARLTTIVQNEARLRDGIRKGEYHRLVSIVMLSYGKHSQTLTAIEGLEKTVRIPHEIILYDNGSARETVDFIKSRIDGQYANVKVFYGDRNLGPAQGRRMALEQARGEWFIIFDNDEIPEPGWLEELLLRAESNDKVGAVCCRVVFPDGKLQFSGGRVDLLAQDDIVIDLALYDRGRRYDDLATCAFRELDWCPIGATLFTVNIAPFLHDGYPNTFEDAGVSFALKKQGLRLLNAPGALVWHEHITFQPKAEMREQYMRDRYNPKLMLKSIASFYRENGLLIKDEYIWRENGLDSLSRGEIIGRLHESLGRQTKF